MAEQKTKPTEQTVESFLDSIPDEKVRNDCYEVMKIMKKATGLKPKMWGTAIVGFGQYHYKYDSGHEGDSCLTGFAPRKANITLYLMGGLQNEELMKKLGKYKTGKGCLYIKKIEDVDTGVLEKLIKSSVDFVKVKFPGK